MTSKTIQNVSVVTVWVPYVGVALRYASSAVNAADRGLKSSLRGLVSIQQAAIKALESAQVVFHAASWVSTLLTVQDIVTANNSEYEVALLNHATLQSIDKVWIRLQTRSSTAQKKLEYIAMASDSRDGFSSYRTYRWLTLPFIKANKLGESVIGYRKGKIYWHAIDVTALQARQGFKSGEVPLGWGGNYLGLRLPKKAKGLAYGGSYKVLPLTSVLAYKSAFRMVGGHKVPKQYRLKEKETPPSITIVVRRPQEAGIEQPLLWGAGRTQLVYSRPERWWPRADQRGEKANLFNALWRRQKAPISAAELQIIGLQV